MTGSKQAKEKNALIQKEQQQLLKIENELKSLLLKINDSLNVLKVEELQLKSNAIIFESPSKTSARMAFNDIDNGPSSSCHKNLNLSKSPICEGNVKNWTESICAEDGINQQKVDLNIKQCPIRQYFMEEDDD